MININPQIRRKKTDCRGSESVQMARLRSACVRISDLVNIEIHGHTVGTLVNIGGANFLGSTASEAASLRLNHHEHLLGFHRAGGVPNHYERLLSLWRPLKVFFTVGIATQDHELRVQDRKVQISQTGTIE